MNSLNNTVKKTIANNLKSLQQGEQINSSKNKIYTGASQSNIPIKEIKNGIIITEDNRYVTIIETLPINYKKKNKLQQTRILRNFGNYFRSPRYKFGFKIVSDINDPEGFITNLRQNCANQENPKIKESLENYINYLIQLCWTTGVAKRFFYIVEYDGIGEEKSRNFEEIEKSLTSIKNKYISCMHDCGNICITPQNTDYAIMEILYKHFNKNTSHKESLKSRIQRINADFAEFNKITGKNKKPTVADYIAPKGLKFINRSYVYMDGYYYSYIGINGDNWPEAVYGGWLECFDGGISIDVDIIFKMLPQYSTSLFLKMSNKSVEGNIKERYRRKKTDNIDEKISKLKNNASVYKQMQHGNDLYDCAIILTIRARTPEELENICMNVKNHITIKLHLAYDDSYLCCEDYFTMTMPLLYITSPFARLKHNILSNDIESIYPFVACQMNDPNGVVLGVNADDNSISSVNNFDSNQYMNANIVIYGKSGAGKTYLEQLFGGRALLNGKRCFYIIPKKGYEYEPGCHNVDGSYIRLGPGQKDRINIMEIRPEGEIKEEYLTDDAIQQGGSWLSNKIISLCTWINLLLLPHGRKMTINEYGKMKIILKNIYNTFGITEQNDSIFEDVTIKKIKVMPIIEDWYNEVIKDESLEDLAHILNDFVNGSCSNMNGQTNVDCNNNYIVLDIDEDKIGEELLPAFLYVGFDLFYSVVKENPDVEDLIFFDEAWKIMQVEEAAKQVQNMVRLVRGYGGATIMATQELAVFLEHSGEYGTAVLSNSDLTIVLNMNEVDLEKAAKLKKLSEQDCENIISFKRGDAMLIAKDDKMQIKIIGSDRESLAFTTDINERKERTKQKV